MATLQGPFTHKELKTTAHTHLLQGQEVLGNVDSSSPAHTHTHILGHTHKFLNTHTHFATLYTQTTPTQHISTHKAARTHCAGKFNLFPKMVSRH